MTNPSDPVTSLRHSTSTMLACFFTLRCEGYEGAGGVGGGMRQALPRSYERLSFKRPTFHREHEKKISNIYTKQPSRCGFEHYHLGMRGSSMRTYAYS